MNKQKLLTFIYKHPAKLSGMFIGLILSILFICIGMIKTVFIIFCIYLGFFFGNKIDNNENIIELLDKILPFGNNK
ncbi:DUF2273 domain-containing protein [Lutibacter sp. B2]|nr:DUF2273 domain-containing protein [Lutibacter sp. B2]